MTEKWRAPHHQRLTQTKRQGQHKNDRCKTKKGQPSFHRPRHRIRPPLPPIVSSIRPPPSSSTTTTTTKAIMNVLEDQVRAAVQQTRQAMEAAFNDLRLARERLRLVKEEYEAAVATDQAARANLQTLREKSAGSETATALAALQREVDQLEKDVRLQMIRGHDVSKSSIRPRLE